MKIITLNFIAFLGYENNTRGGGEHGIKKMITTSMLTRQLWMTNDDEFNHVAGNSQSVLKLTLNMKTIHMLKILQKSAASCFIWNIPVVI